MFTLPGFLNVSQFSHLRKIATRDKVCFRETKYASAVRLKHFVFLLRLGTMLLLFLNASFLASLGSNEENICFRLARASQEMLHEYVISQSATNYYPKLQLQVVIGINI